MPLGRLLVLCASLALATVVLAAPASAEPETWTVPPSARITIDGHGYGHGRGLSQYGAEHAARQGVGYRDIVGYYYPGTAWGRATGSVRVWLTKGDVRNVLQVDARSGLKARKTDGSKTWVLAKQRKKAKAWRIVPDGDQHSVLEYRTGGWHRLRTVKGGLELTAGAAPVRLHLNDGGTATYRGALRSVPSSPGHRITVNVLPLESYLRGVVPAETFASTWRPATLRAQAVAARTYATHQRVARAAKVFDVCDTESCQVYAGASREHPRTDAAVQATASEILTYDDRPAFTEFSASSGGWTAAGDAPYLTAMEDRYAADDDPWLTWERTRTDAQVEQAWPGVGDLTGIAIDGREGHGEWGGRAGTVSLTGDAGVVVVGAAEFAQRLDLPSSWLTLAVG